MNTRLAALVVGVLLIPAARSAAQANGALPPVPTPTDIKPGSITCDECPYPYPTKYLPISVYGQDVRIAYMDVAPAGTASAFRSGCRSSPGRFRTATAAFT